MLEIRTLNAHEFPTSLHRYVHIRSTSNGLFIARGAMRTPEGVMIDFTPPPVETLGEAIRVTESWANQNATELVVYLTHEAREVGRHGLD